MPAFLLAAADAACPRMKDCVPESLLKKLQPGKLTGFLCLGDIGRPIMHAFKRIATDFKRVSGYKEDEAHLPESLVCLDWSLDHCPLKEPPESKALRILLSIVFLADT
jgi:hypothetical protein